MVLLGIINKSKMCLLTCASNYLGVVFIIFNFIRISNTLVSHSELLAKNDFCKFPLNNGGFIDLSSLNSSQPLTVSTETSLYIYHLCTDVPLSSEQVGECNKSYGLCYFKPKTPTDKPVDFNKVVKNETIGSFTLLARNVDGDFQENRVPEIVYKHTKNNKTVITYVQLECDEKVENFKLTITKSLPLEHALILSSIHVCVQTPHYMSGGTVFFIILVVFAALYFIGGILVLKFIRGATGIEMIPNHEFWCSLPQHARDGFKYLASCGKNASDSYEKI